MSKVITILLFATLCASVQATTKTLWGSRVVTKPSGEETLTFQCELPAAPKLTIINDKGETKEEECAAATTTSLTDCSFTKSQANPAVPGKVTIKVKDAAKQKKISFNYKAAVTVQGSEAAAQPITVYFVPSCKFDPAVTGGLILKESAPLSRFVTAPTATLTLPFAVDGESSKVILKMNGKAICTWTGKKLTTGQAADCVTKKGDGGNAGTDLELNVAKTMRSATVMVPVQANAKDVFEWSTDNTIPPTSLSITVDGSGAGTSPELADCKAMDTTTSAGQVAAYMTTANVGMLGALLYLRK